MNHEPVTIFKPTNGLYRIIEAKTIRIPTLFTMGFLLSVVLNSIADGNFTKFEVDLAQSSIDVIFTDNRNALTTFILLLKHNMFELHCILLSLTASITVFPYTILSVLSACKGFVFGRICIAIIFVCRNNLYLKHPILSSFVAVLCYISINIIYICYNNWIFTNHKRIKKTESVTEHALLFSSDSAKLMINTLVAIGTVIIFSLIKSFLLYLITFF